MYQVSYDGIDYLLFWFPVNWRRQPFECEFEMQSVVSESKSGKQDRKRLASNIRFSSISYDVVCRFPDNHDFRESLLLREEEKILVPLWPAIYDPEDFSDPQTAGFSGALNLSVALNPSGEIDFGSGYEVHGGATPSAGFQSSWSNSARTVPLAVCDFTARVNPSLITDSISTIRIQFKETGPSEYRIQLDQSSYAQGPQLDDGTIADVAPLDHDFSEKMASGGAYRYLETSSHGQSGEESLVSFSGYANRNLRVSGTFGDREMPHRMARFFLDKGATSGAFWVPSNISEGNVSNPVAAGQVNIPMSISPRSSLSYHPWIAVLGLYGKNQYTKAQSFDSDSITLEDALDFDISPKGTLITSLLYGRFASKSLRIRWDRPTKGSIEFEFEEVSSEYVLDGGDERGVTLGDTGFEASLYHFFSQNSQWFLTSFDANVSLDGTPYLKSGMTHDTVRKTRKLDDSTTLSCSADSCVPMQLYADMKIPSLHVRIMKCSVLNGVATIKKTVFDGEAGLPKTKGNDIEIPFEFMGDDLEIPLPKSEYRGPCWHEFGIGGCNNGGNGVDLADWTFSGQFSDVGELGYPYSFVVDTIARDNEEALPVISAKRFAGGMLWVDDGDGLKSQYITSNTALSGGQITFTLAGDLDPFPVNGQSLKFQPSCDGQLVSCQYFGNEDNYAGCKKARGNLSLFKVSSDIGGGKKG